MRKREHSTWLGRQGSFLVQLALLEKAQPTALVSSVRFTEGDRVDMIRADHRTVAVSINARSEDLAYALSDDDDLVVPALRESPDLLPRQELIDELWGEALWDCGAYVDCADDFIAGDMRYELIEHDRTSVTVVAIGRGTRVINTAHLGVDAFPMALPIDLATEIISAVSSPPPTQSTAPTSRRTFGWFDIKE